MDFGTHTPSLFGSKTCYRVSQSLVLQVVLIQVASGSQIFRGFVQLGQSLDWVRDRY